MPTYEYICKDCDRKVEYFQSMKEEARTVCPRCDGRLVRLVSSGAGLIFKGSGFYITDYKHKETGNSHKLKGKPLHPEEKSEAKKPETADAEK